MIPLILVTTALTLSSQVTSRSPIQPSGTGEIFAIDQSTGAVLALEHVRTRNHAVGGPVRKGVFQPLEQPTNVYIEGGASPVELKAGETPRFVVRLMSPGDRYGRVLTVEEVLRHVALNPMVAGKIKTLDVRFMTKTDIPMDVQTYGQSTPGLDPKKPDRAAQSFVLIPRTALAPGQYLLLITGVHDGELISNRLLGTEWSAFGIPKP